MEWPHLIALHINRYMKILFIVAIIFAVIAFVALTLGCTTIAAGVFSLALGSIGTMLGLRP